jgi:Histidine kinase
MKHPQHLTPLTHLLPAVVLNSVIALGITVFGEHNFASNFVFSQCIGLSIGLLIHLASSALISDYALHWRRLAAIVPVSAVVGLLAGSALADWLTQSNSLGYWSSQPRKAFGFLTISLVAGAALTYFFVSRGQLAVERQNAEAARRLAAESRLKLLQTQLEPHMLFNTLANLRVLIPLEPARAQTMLDHLIAYLRATLSASQATTHTLQTEFDRLNDYLELMAVRMGTRLQYAMHLPAELAGVEIPTLLLQPLVENAIAHGLEPKVEGGSITVSAAKHGTTLQLVVQDTGLGFDFTRPAPPPTPAPGRGYGLAHVRDRLQTLYGAAATIKFVAVSVGGTRASIEIPLNS